MHHLEAAPQVRTNITDLPFLGLLFRLVGAVQLVDLLPHVHILESFLLAASAVVPLGRFTINVLFLKNTTKTQFFFRSLQLFIPPPWGKNDIQTRLHSPSAVSCELAPTSEL